jgi:hypothetical protein
MAYVQLIDTDYVFLHTTIDQNTDPALINPNILVAQDTTIQQIIGQNLYQTLMNQVYDGSIESAGNIAYKTLLNNFIQPALGHWAVWYSLPDIQYRLTNKSILSKTTDSAKTTGLDELIYLRNNVKHYADFYNQRIREQIVNNPSSYPEYFQTIGIDRIRPKRTTYFSGWSTSPTNSTARRLPGYSDPDCCDDPWGTPLNWT